MAVRIWSMRKSNTQLFLNIVASILAFLINTGIQFVITPILTQNVGDEAYGFITIANDFVSYAGIFAAVLNSVAARFISVEIHKENNIKAEEYYSSIFFGNVLISIVLAILGFLVIIHFDTFLNVSPELVPDITILFAITFGNYIISVLISLFTVSIYVKDRIDLLSIRNIGSYIVRLIVVVLLFSLANEVKIFYLAIATLISTIFLGITNSSISRKIMPEIHIKRNKVKLIHIFELLKTGIWMIINNMSNVIADNFTAIIINRGIGAETSGFFSVARTIPSAANSLIYTIHTVFVPTYYKLYANNSKEELIKYGIRSMKIMTFIVATPLLVFCFKAKDFLQLWQSYRTSVEINELSVVFTISLILCLSYTSVISISQLGLVANRIKWQTINNIVVSISILGSTIYCVYCTNWGIIGITVLSLIINCLKWVFFTPIYSAYVIGAPVLVFFASNLKIILSEGIIGVLIFVLSRIVLCESWGKLILVGVGLCIPSYLLHFLLLFTKDERRTFIEIIKEMVPIRTTK